MILLVLAFSFGLYAAFQLTELPSVYWCLMLPVFLLSFATRFAWLKWVSLFGFSFLYVIAYAYLIQSVELDRTLQKKDLTLIGTIADLPEKKGRATRFLFDVDRIYYQGHRIEGPGRVRLSWYQLYEPVRVGERWQLVVRLKRPHGFSNPGSFDYERWLFERGIGATGYVRKSETNVRLETAPFQFAQLRESLRSKIQTILSDSPMSGFIQALVIGERADLTDEHWRVLNATGTNHLMAISGLHIGLVAGFVFFLIKFLWRRS
ncbi:MAG: ComEC/Rec2 family competence protein, partial [Gammaproteobacteria bacterium]|nr:ComEC/Rec2 family competence protein [Gammaproteobacteria bacterium]